MKNFLISGLVDDKYRIKVNLLAISLIPSYPASALVGIKDESL